MKAVAGEPWQANQSIYGRSRGGSTMTAPRRLERALTELRPLLNNVLTLEECRSANRVWAILQNEAPVEFEKELPDEIGNVLTDDELENIIEYLDKVQAEVNR